jgi:hypothetical protein
MKNTLLCFWLLMASAITGCNKESKIDPELDSKDNPLKVYTQDLQQAKMWLPGKWKLVKVSAMIPNPSIPNVELLIEENQISVIEDGMQIDKVKYEIISKDSWLLVKTNAQPREDNWYVRNPGLLINETRMYLDLGRAQDLPGYEFKKVD